MKQHSSVNIYGDSILRGTVIDERRRYHTTVSPYLEALTRRFGISFKNRAHFGLTIDKGRALLERDLEKGLDCDYAVLGYGGNDCSFLWDEVAGRPEARHLPLTGIEDFSHHCLRMIGELRAAGVVPVLMTLPPIDAVRYLAFVSRNEEGRKSILQWLGDVQIIYRVHEKYSRCIAQIARQTDTLLADVRNRFLDRHDLGRLLGLDGVHLTAAGYTLLAGAFADFVEARRREPRRLVFG